MIIAAREDVNIIDSNVPVVEEGVAVFSSDDSYVTGDEVQVNGTVNKKYRAIKDGGEIISPDIDVNADGVGEYWYQFESTNYAKAFDELTSSVCSNDDYIYYKFSVSDVDLLYVGNVNCKSIRVVVTNTDTDTVLFDNTTETITREVNDWFDWIYAKDEFINEFFTILPMAYNTEIELYLYNEDSTAIAGHIAYGISKYVGLTLAYPNPTTTRRSLTTKSRDEWGNIVTRRKARYKRMTINLLIDNKYIDFNENRIEKFVDIPCIFVGDEREGGYKSLLMFGELKDHDMPIGISKTQYKLEVEGYI